MPLTIDRRDCQKHCRRIDLEKTEIQTVSVKSISLTFQAATLSENLSTVDLQKTNSVEDERSQFQLLSIGSIVEIIVDVWIWKKRDLVDEDRSEFQLLSIDESLKIIVEDESTKDRFIRFERES